MESVPFLFAFINTMRSKLFLFILFLLTLSFVCCKKEDKKAVTNVTEVDSMTLKVGLMPTFDCLPFYVAKEKGFYDSIKANVSFLTYGSAMDADTAFKGKTVDGMFTDLCHVAALSSEGYNLNVIAGTYGRQVLVGSKTVRIRKMKDLKERMIAIARGDQSKLFLQAMLKRNKIGRDIIYLPQINNLQIRYTMLCNGQVDAAILPEPYAAMAQMGKNKALSDNDAFGINLSCMVMSERAQKKKNTEIRRLMMGYNMAVEAINKSKPKAFAKILTTYYHIPAAVADTFRLPKFHKASVPSVEEWKCALSWMQSEGLASGRMKGNGIIINDYIQ